MLTGQTLAVLATAGYGAAVVAYFLHFCRRGPKAGRLASLVLCAAVAVHVVWLFAARIALGHLPLANAPQALSLVALGIALAYVVIELLLGRREFGAFITPVAFLFQAVAAGFLAAAPEPQPRAPILESGWFEIHVGTALFSYCAFAIAFAAGLMHILLCHELRLKRLGFFFERMPPLDALARINAQAVALGFLFLTIGIASGVIWSLNVPRPVLLDAKEVSAIIVWLAYAANIHVRWRMGWRGQRAAIFSVINFVLLFAVFCLTSFVLKAHQF